VATERSTGTLEAAGYLVEYAVIGGPPERVPTIVVLHEGLGSVSAWRDFPERLAAATGTCVIAYSRPGYGESSPVGLPRPLDYMQREAATVLPAVLDAIGFRRGLLLGHSDGASIAAAYLGSVADHRVRGAILLAPHFVAEDVTVAEIARVKAEYETSGLGERLARHHGDADAAFRGWAGAWLDPGFRAFDLTAELEHIRVPLLIVQGDADPYGSTRQVELAEEHCTCPVERLILTGCGHAPHRERPDETLTSIASFTDRLLRLHHEAEAL
jgi:pimeloyl-ACP methyl ester carboxylesterase